MFVHTVTSTFNWILYTTEKQPWLQYISSGRTEPQTIGTQKN